MNFDISVFQYNEQKITFKLANGEVMVNATQMAKPFGKRPDKYLMLESTKEFMQVLEGQLKGNSSIGDYQLVMKIKGGVETEQGTWLNQTLAIDFARWLSPEFNLWTIDKIMELIQKGTVSIEPELSNLEKAKKLIEQCELFVKTEEAKMQLEIKE